MKRPCAKCGGSERYPRGDCKACARIRSTVVHKRRLAGPDGAQYQQRKNLQVRLNKYSLTETELRDLLDAQGGCCAICRGSVALIGHGTAVDHDHDTGEVRGFLCRTCNTILGMAKDSPLRLRAAATYLDRRQPKLRLVR